MSHKTLVVSCFVVLSALFSAAIVSAKEPQPRSSDAPARPAALITVNTVSDVFANDGLCTLREAIQSANATMPVGGCLSGGAGKDTITITATGTITLTSALDPISGDLDMVGPGAGALTISGNSLYRVLMVNSGVRVNLSGATIADGFALADFGGGLVNSGTMTLTDSIVFRNSHTDTGGGIYNVGEMIINHSMIYSNTAALRNGGGIFNNGGALMIVNSEILSNSASSMGGGLYSRGGMVILSSTNVAANTANNFGAGLRVEQGELELINSTVNRNEAYWGGGLYGGSNSRLTIDGSTFSRNRAKGDLGGGVFIQIGEGTNVITNSTFVGNMSVLAGGGIYVVGLFPSLSINNSTLAENSAPTGGGIYVSQGSVTLRNTLVVNSLGADNCGGSITDGGNNLQYGGMVASSCGATIATADPKLSLLGAHGGGTDTMALMVGSAATDAGNPATCAATDQRGVARALGLACDIGAYEGALGPGYLPIVAR